MEPSFKTLITEYVTLIKQKMNTIEMKKMKEENNYKYIKTMREFLPIFYEKYPKLFKKIIQGDSLEHLDLFLNKFDDIESGKVSFNDAREDLGQILHNKYVANKIDK